MITPIFILFYFILASPKQLLMIQSTFRHGARYPINVQYIDNSNIAQEQKSIGELTAQGKNMQYLLGQIIYDQYWEKLFEGTPYLHKYNQSQFYVKSTDYNRTIESVQSQLFGLLQKLPPLQLTKQDYEYSLPAWNGYEGGNVSSSWNVFTSGPAFHPIPIHVEKGGANGCQNGDFLRGYSPENCPNQEIWMEQNRQNERCKQVQDNEKVKEAVNGLQKAVKNNISFFDVTDYFDSYICLKYLNQQYLPIFNDSTYSQTFDFIRSFSMYNDLYSQPKQIKVVATNYVKRTMQNIKGKINSTFTPRIVLYSAHDTTIGMLLSAFNMTNVECIIDHYLNKKQNDDTCIWKFPIFTSNLIIEVWNDNNRYHIQMLYNGQRRKLPFCDYKYECPIEQFQKWHDDFIVGNVGQECGWEERQTSWIGIIISLGVINFILVGYLIYVKCVKGKAKEDQNYHQNFEEKDMEMEKA